MKYIAALLSFSLFVSGGFFAGQALADDAIRGPERAAQSRADGVFRPPLLDDGRARCARAAQARARAYFDDAPRG